MIDPLAVFAQVGSARQAAVNSSGDGSTAQWIALASAVFAALAASASWASVRFNRRQWLASQQPFLVLQLSVEPSGGLRLVILNAGNSAARGVRFCVAARKQFAAGYAGGEFGGYLAPGQRARIKLELSGKDGDKIRGVAVCWDGAGRVQRFSDRGDCENLARPRGNSETASDPLEAFSSFFGAQALQGHHRVQGQGLRGR